MRQQVGARELVTLTGASTFGDALRAFLLAIQRPGPLREAVTGLGGVSVPARARPQKVDWSGARLDLLRSGKSGQEIAHALGVALRTVTEARRKIFGPFNKEALIRALRELGDVPVTAELLAYHLGRSTTAVRQLVKKVTGEELP